MKQKLSLVFAVILISICGFSQDMESKYSGPKKGGVLAVHFNMSDYKAPIGIKSPVSGKVYSTIPEMSKGFSISYWRGLTNKIDLSLKATGTFLEYPTLSSTVVSRREFSPEAEAALNIRPYGNKHQWWKCLLSFRHNHGPLSPDQTSWESDVYRLGQFRRITHLFCSKTGSDHHLRLTRFKNGRRPFFYLGCDCQFDTAGHLHLLG